MSKARNDLIALLSQEEPEPGFWQNFDNDDLSDLAIIAAELHDIVAARALLVIAKLNASAAIPIALTAANSTFAHMKLAALSAAENLPREVAVKCIHSVLKTDDPSLQKHALLQAEKLMLSELKPAILVIQKATQSPFIRELALTIANTL